MSPMMLLGKTSVEEEVRIGRQVAGDLLGAAPLVKDDTLQRYVNTVGRWVATQSSRKDLDWHFGVIESEDINAFATPGGYIFLTRGLYKRLNNEAELAGVLAHEIAHVSKKHHLELLKQKLAGTDPAAAARHVDVISSEIRRLDDVVQGFLKFVRPEDVVVFSLVEFQLVDEATARHNEQGAAAHARYKKRQRKRALRRLSRGLVVPRRPRRGG